MSAKWLYLVVLLLAIGCQPQTVGNVEQNKAALSAKDPNQAQSIAETKISKQLKIYKSTLFDSSSEQLRIDAATEMLFSEDPLARKILLAALSQSENSAARVAVCKALSQARASQEAIKEKGDFIQPLLGILTTEGDFARAKLAAEATLIFEYGQVSKQLEEIVTNSSLPPEAKTNAVYALKLQPDMKAIFKLMDLLDGSDKQVAAEAEKALKSIGIPVGKDAETRRQIRNELERKGRDEVLREWLIRQEAQIRQMQIELNTWQGRYLLALGKIYDSKSDDTAKAQFLTEHLSSSEAIIRLWALEKVYQDRVGTRLNPKLPAEVGPILVGLISDQNKDIRLRTAKLLSLMGELNSAQRLLTQLDVEQDDEVKMELFVAMGYALLPNPKIKIPDETRKQALEWTVRYLAEQDPEKAQKGAEVMKKLLEQNGLTAAEVDRYLDLLVERYIKGKADGNLCGELLSTMAGLCAPQSAYNAQSKRRFNPLFEEALSDKTNLVREAAVEGLVYVDMAAALKRLRKDFVNDPSIIIRKRLMELAGKVGGKEDLVWLAEKIGSSAESELAWQAMLKIFNGSDADVLNQWIEKFVSEGSKVSLSDEQKISFLEIAERKAVGENKSEMLRYIRERLAKLYIKLSQFELAADYLGRLYEAAQTAEEKEKILPDLLDVYLRWPKIELATKLVENSLLEKDLDPNSVIIRSIDDYMSKSPDKATSNAVLEAMRKINTLQPRPMWQGQLRQWAGRFGEASDLDKPKKRDN